MSDYKADIYQMPALDKVIDEFAATIPNFEILYETAVAEAEFALAVSRLRESRKITQGELGAIINLSQSRIAQIENGKHSPSLVTIARLGSALGARFIIEPGGSVRVQQTKKWRAATGSTNKVRPLTVRKTRSKAVSGLAEF